MTYQQKLKLPKWQKRRLEKMQEAGWQCEKCYRDDMELHVHHKRYRNGKEPWEYDLSELECLCNDCHADAHNKLVGKMGPSYPKVYSSTASATQNEDTEPGCEPKGGELFFNGVTYRR